MAKRIGKYKVSKREETLSAVDGATIEGSLTGITNLTTSGTNTFSGVVTPSGGAMTTVTNINTATNLSNSQCGYIAIGAAVGTAQAAGTGFNINLPTPARGLFYHFVLRAPSIANNSNAAITITATSDGSTAADIMIGSVTVNEAPTNVVAGVDIITFVHNAATAGDSVSCFCDGTNWFVSIVGDAAGSVTLA